MTKTDEFLKGVHPFFRIGREHMYRAILFDVSDTLVDYAPNYAQIYGDRLRALGFAVDSAKAREIRRAVNWAIGVQSLREM